MGGIASTISDIVNPVSSISGSLGALGTAPLGGAVGGTIMGIVNQLGLDVKPADFGNLQAAYAASGGNLDKFNQSFQQLQQQSNAQLGQTQQALGQAGQALTGAQTANQQVTGDALGILRGAATGSAPSAAQAQLQSGKDQAISTQMAMANSGNLSQMIGGQKEAMANAANITQQAANQAAQLRANEMATARSQYGQEATQYASQAGTNASLAQGLSGQQASLYGTQLGQQSSMAGAANAALANQTTAAQAEAALEQQANEATAKYKAQAAGGLMNGTGGAAGALAKLSTGGKLVGEEIEEGDSEKNDVIPVALSAGEIVIPKSHAKSIPMALKYLEKIMKSDESDDHDHDGLVRPDDVKEKSNEKHSKSFEMLLDAYKRIEKKVDSVDSYFKNKSEKKGS